MKVISYQNKFKKIAAVLFFIVGISIPFSFAFNSISIAVFFLFSFAFYSRKKFVENLKKEEIYLFYILFFLIQAVSIMYADNFKLAFETVKRNIVFLLLPIAFINYKQCGLKKEFKAAYIGLLISILLTLIISIYNLLFIFFTKKISINDFFRERFVDEGLYAIHVPYLAMLIVFALIVAYNFTFIKNKKHNRKIKTFVFILLMSSLIFLSGVMSLVILFLFCTLQLLKSNYSNRTKIGVAITISSLVIFSFFYLKSIDKIERVRGSENLLYRAQNILNTKGSVRVENWKSVLQVIVSSPIIGISADGGLALLQKERKKLSEPYINKHNAHNDFFEIMLRYGIIGVCIYSILLLKLFFKAKKKNNYFLKWFLIVFLISGLTESYLQRQVGLTFFVFFSLLLYNYEPQKNE